MSWFLSLMLIGAVVTTGSNLPNYEYQNAVVDNPKIIKKLNSDETETFEKTYPFDPNGKIEVSNINGSIYVEAWDRPEIHLSATKVADTKERLSDVQIEIEESNSSFKVSTDYKRHNNYQDSNKNSYSKLYVTFRLKVPRTAFLDEIETVNGSVEVSNMTNYTEISAVNGAVKASNLRGTAKLSTVNGAVYADFDDLNDNSSISLGTVNGSVKLNIPSSANATIKANSVNGSISNEFSLPVRKGKYVGRDLYGRIGNGNVKIKLSSVNGGLSINNKDGGNTNPVVNLLPQKTSDDFDDSFEVSINIDTDKMTADIDKAFRESKQATEITRTEAMKQRQIEREQRRIQRDVERKQRNIERKIEREKDKEKHKLDKEKFEELESEMERFEEDSVRASEAVYLTRRSPFVQEKTGSFEVEGIAKVTVDAEDCDVLVRGWDKQEVKYTISRITRTGNNIRDLKTKISSDKSNVEIEVTNDSPSAMTTNDVTNRVRVEVFVPKKSNLKISSNREIRLEGVKGNLELNGSDETINVRDSYGKLKVVAVDGTVRIIGFEGELETTAVDGDVYLEGNFKKLRTESKDGNVYLTLPDGLNATLITNGTVDFKDLKLTGEVNVKKGATKTLNVGKGGLNYNFNFGEDGSLIVRSKSSLSEE